VRAVQEHHPALGDGLGHRQADLLDLLGLQAADEGHGAAQRMPPQHPVHVVGQGVVDGGLDVAVEGQHALAVLVVRAVGHVVQQHLFVPAGEGLLVAEVLQRRFAAGPAVLALAADAAGRDRAHQLRALGGPQGTGLPAAQQR
jgi:hypothetical protein